MAVKPETGGAFERTPEGLGAAVKRPGYPEAFRKKLVEQTGDRYRCPEGF